MVPKKEAIPALAVFVIAFLVTLFFTSGIPFFWEHTETFILPPAKISVPAMFLGQLKTNLFGVSYTYRPMSPLLVGIERVICGAHVETYRYFMSFFYSILVLVCFLFLKRFTSILVAFLGSVFLIFAPQNWFIITYLEIGLLSHLFLAVSFLIFLHTYRLEDRKLLKFLNLIIIFLLVFISIGTKHEGRYAVFVMFTFCLLFYRKFIVKNWWFFLLLLSISLPVLSLLKMGKSHNEFISLKLNPDIYKLSAFFVNFEDPVSILGVFLWLALLFSLLVHLLIGIKRRDAFFWLKEKRAEGLAFSFCWFIFALVFNFFIQGWVDLPKEHFSRIYYFYLWMPFLVFTFTVSYSAYVYLRRNKIFLVIFILLFSLSFVKNAKLLYYYRAGWGGYWTGLNNLKNFIVTRDDNALLLIPPMHFFPWIFFYGSNNQVELTSKYNDLGYIKECYAAGKFKNIYVASLYSPLDFKEDKAMESLGCAQTDSNCLFDKFRHALGKKPNCVFYIYRYRY